MTGTSTTNLVWIGEGGVSDAVRMGIHAQELSEHYDCHFITLPRVFRLDEYTINSKVAIFCRPHTQELVGAYKKKGIKIVVDMDDDFWAIPKEHPGYKAVGPGNPVSLGKIETCIGMADLLTVSTEELAERFQRFDKPVRIIPNGWTKRNPLWFSRSPDRPFTVGFTGTITHREDFQVVVNPIKRFLKRFPKARLAIGTDGVIYRLFKDVPEQQKIFLPMVDYEHYPYILSYFDVLMAPLDNTYFNRAKSDIKMVDAGARGIPWVASMLPMYVNWGIGGILADTPESWYTALYMLYSNNQDSYCQFAQLGHEKALTREASVLSSEWKDVVENL